MADYQALFTQAYWWLSILGGLHCFAVALFLRFSLELNSTANRLLPFLFALIGWYFITGLIHKGLMPSLFDWLLPLVYPTYFVLMPLVYCYSKTSLQPNAEVQYRKHFAPALIIALVIFALIAYQVLTTADLSQIRNLDDLRFIEFFALVLPLLTLLQSAFYFIHIFRLIKTSQHQRPATDGELYQIRLRWIYLLVSGILLNWVIRVALIYYPFYTGLPPSMPFQAITSFCLLVTVYIFAFYGFHQIGRTAYLRGLSRANRSKPQTSKEIIDQDEMAFLQDLLADKNPQTPTDKSDRQQ
ncbi:hypothetical protein [Motilimonas sp. KMU-193]|uniref:hypothetical protein n=1 Tax=Motilimonas sp. KMU-193 TaxID=3388668 RepID=UPI00396B1ED8